MTYTALYREWRPQAFAEVVGQSHIVTTLMNAIRLDRIAHAYLFSGPRGTGKTSVAKIMARAVNCERIQGVEPCNECPSCRGILEGRVVDVVEMDAASNRGIDEIRSLLEQVQYAPSEAKRKVYIIDEVHMLTPEAFNALLKTIEEPPSYCLFILATTEIHKVPATIASRCQRFDFGRLSSEIIVERLRKVAEAVGVAVEEPAFWYVARAAEGGLRDALALFDQTIAYSGGAMGIEEVAAVAGGVPSEQVGALLRHILDRNHVSLLLHLNGLWQKGTEPLMLLVDLLAYCRDVILAKKQVAVEEVQDRGRFDPTFPVVVQSVPLDAVLALVDRLIKWQAELRYQTQARMFVEVGLLAVTTETTAEVTPRLSADAVVAAPASEMIMALRELTKRVADLEQKVADSQTQSSFAATPVQTASAQASRFERQDAVKAVPSPRPMRQHSGITVGEEPGAEDQRLLAKIKNEWQAVLEEVKKHSIQTRAWLLAGTPEEVRQGVLITVFQGQVHAETVMRSPHKDIIEGVLRSLFRAPIKLRAVRIDEWDAFKSSSVDVVKSDSPHEPWVEQVLEWFGEDRVELQDETER